MMNSTEYFETALDSLVRNNNIIWPHNLVNLVSKKVRDVLPSCHIICLLLPYCHSKSNLIVLNWLSPILNTQLKHTTQLNFVFVISAYQLKRKACVV